MSDLLRYDRLCATAANDAMGQMKTSAPHGISLFDHLVGAGTHRERYGEVTSIR